MTVAKLLIWDEEACRTVHDAILSILSDPGVEVRHPEARRLLSTAGAHVDGTRVTVPRELVEHALRSAPKSFLLGARDGDAGLVLEQGRTYYGTGGDCLYTRDPGTGERRLSIMRDVEEMAALAEALPHVDFVMSMALPSDAPSSVWDLAQFGAMLRGTKKPLVLSAQRGDTLAVLCEMEAACGGNGSFAVYAMPSPPLTHDHEALDKVIDCARRGIPLIYASAPAAGSAAPSSNAATIVSGNAEILSALVVHQLASPGAPFVYGFSQGAINMRTTAEVYCSPEQLAVQQANADLARHYELPSFGWGGCSDAKLLDGQWALETAVTIVLGALARPTMIHDMGYLESGMQGAREAIVLADEMVGYAEAIAKGVPVDETALALDEIRAVGPGGTHLGRRHTREHHRGFWRTELLDQWAHDHWAADGSKTLLERLHARVRVLEAQPRTYTLSSEVQERLDRLVESYAAAESTTSARA
jgi:trimethylamine--corrinoid protein Co-methyltransferase